MAAAFAGTTASLGLLVTSASVSSATVAPFVAHPRATLVLVSHAADNSFPSDHASVTFAIALAVVVFGRRVGLVLLVGAVAIAIDRIFVGVHYPIDVLSRLLIGLLSAELVAVAGRGVIAWTVEQA
jgi:undecaprenyl-diphosphatase